MRSATSIVLAAVLCFVIPAASGQPLQGTLHAVSFTGPVTGRTVQFNIYLPPGYNTDTGRYPVIYHLHGIGGNQGGQQNTTVPASFETARANGVIGPVIVVFPNGYTDAWWADSISGDKPAETDVVLQVIPYVDANYRTNATRGQRIIQGFSMGGFGTTKFYSKFPHLFAACIEYDGALVTWATMLQSHPDLALSIFGNDEAYFDQYSPRFWSTTNAITLRAGPPIRMVAGALVGGNRQFRDFLTALQIPVDYIETGCAHQIGCLFTAQGQASAAFIASALVPPCPTDLNGDGLVNTTDLTAFLARFGQSVAPGSPGDFDSSGQVNTADLTVFLAAFGSPC